LVLLGKVSAPLGGSVFARHAGLRGATVPDTDAAANFRLYRAYAAARDAGLVLSAHDVSEGGLAVALAEMGFSLTAGLDIDLPGADDVHTALFHEGTGRLIVEVAEENMDALLDHFRDLPLTILGQTNAEHRELRVTRADEPVLTANLADLKEIWSSRLAEYY
jgi:phosphoribosylformylglycinamidine synthase